VLHLASASAALHAGEEVFSDKDANQPAGMVAQACHHLVHGHWALVCLQNSVFEDNVVSLSTAQGAKLTMHALPYALRDDIVELENHRGHIVAPMIRALPLRKVMLHGRHYRLGS
jgi:hypothetical protein